MTRPLRLPAGPARDAAGGVVVGRVQGERQAKALAVAPGRALQAKALAVAPGRALLAASSGAGPVEASGGVIAAPVRRASVGAREANAAQASAVVVPVARVVVVPVARVVLVANVVEGVVVRAVSAVVVRAVSAVVVRAANGVEARASGGGPANEGGVRTGPRVRRRPAPRTPSG